MVYLALPHFNLITVKEISLAPPSVFAAAGLLVLLIALLTMSSQALRSARMNPTDCLRDE